MADKRYKITMTLTDGSQIDAGIITAPQGPAGDPGLTPEQISMFTYLAQHMTVDEETGKVTFACEIEAPAFNAATGDEA